MVLAFTAHRTGAPLDVQTADSKKSVLHAEYKVIGKDQLVIGPCRYEVFRVEHSNSFREGPLHVINIDWYAPDIRLIVAREYERSSGETVIHKYDAITILSGGERK